MDDQADGLRRLVRREESPSENGPRNGPRLVLVTSGKGGVGTTAIAVGLAAIAAERGKRTVLIDADPHGGDVAAICNVSEPWTIADVFASRTTTAEALQQGFGGIRVLPGAWAQENLEEYPTADHERLIEQLGALEPQADHIFIDGGCGSGRVLRRFWRSAHAVVVVTTPEQAAVMNTYASIKLLASAQGEPRIHALVNRAANRVIADDVHERLARSCRRFLGIEIHYAGRVPEHRRWFHRGKPATPAAIRAGRAGRELRRVASVLLPTLEAAAGQADAQQPAVAERLSA